MTEAGGAWPLVTVAVPLYRSRRFLQIVTDNLDAIDYPHLEILVSDRHHADDAIDVLKARYRADARFTFVTATDEIDWVDHFNLLLRQATGTYFLWMAHDDSYPADYVRQLVAALEQHPDAVLAFGQVDSVSVDGFLPAFPFTPPPVTNDEVWSMRSALKVLTLWQLWIAFRGVIRRDVVARRDLYLRHTYRNIRADIYWVFALLLSGRLLYVASCRCTKRFERGSGGAAWRFGPRQSLNACRVLRSYLHDHARSRTDSVVAQTVIIPWCLAQGFLPARFARRLGVTIRKRLTGRA